MGPTGWLAIPIITGVSFAALQIFKSCEQSNATTESMNRSVQQYGIELTQQQGVVRDENTVVRATAAVGSAEAATARALQAVAQEGAADTIKLKQVITDLLNQITPLTQVTKALMTDLDASKKENADLKAQVAKFSDLLTQFHAEVQRVAGDDAELKKIDLSWDASINDFQQKADSFKQLMAQMNGRSELVSSLTAKKGDLEGQLAALQATVDRMTQDAAALGKDNQDLQQTNESLKKLNDGLKAIGATLDAERAESARQKVLFEQMQANHAALIKTVTTASATLSPAPGESTAIMQLVHDSQIATQRRLAQLKAEEKDD
jgi:chromosome segregation ATPase